MSRKLIRRPATVACLVLLLISFSARTQSAQTALTIGPRNYSVTEVRANNFTANTQRWPQMTRLVNGNLIVGWESWYQGSVGTECIGRVYSTAGVPLTGEFFLNPANMGCWEYGPSFAPLPSGGFGVAWGRCSASANLQMFGSSNNALGGDVVVTSRDVWPRVCATPSGDFVVSWDRTSHGVGARRYNSSGVPYGPEFQVNTVGLNWGFDRLNLSSSAAGPNGWFWIVWAQGDGNIKARIYDQNGVATGTDFVVNSSTGGSRTSTAVAYLQNGDVIVAWVGSGNGDSNGVWARRFSPTGAALGAEWDVDGAAPGSGGGDVGIAADIDGSYVITWSGSDGSSSGVRARIYSPSDIPLAGQFGVNLSTSGAQNTGVGARNVVASGGDLAFLWYGSGPGDGEGIFLSIFDLVGTNATYPGSGEDFVLASGVDAVPTQYPNVKSANAGQMVNLLIDSPLGSYDYSIPFLVGQVFPTGFPPMASASYPESHLSAANAVVIFDGSNAGWIGPFVLPPAGMTFTMSVPPGLAGISAIFQAGSFMPSSMTGHSFTLSSGQELQF